MQFNERMGGVKVMNTIGRGEVNSMVGGDEGQA